MPERIFTIFVLEDDEWYNRLLVHAISHNPDFIVKSFHDTASFFATLHEKPHAVTLDYRLPGTTGDVVLEQLKRESPETDVIIISEQNDIETAITLFKKGAYDYLVKEKHIKDRLLGVLLNIKNKNQLQARINSLEKDLEKKFTFNKGIIGNSEGIQKTMALAEKAAATSINVTILGETGTGKEVIAKAIHYHSSRKSKPLVTVNVAAIPAELIESELFGHEKGAFTGASARRIGKFEEAHGGTLFLDEIGEMELPLQAKLLRALQEREVIRIGSNTPVKTDCRIIVATHRNLKDDVKSGRFREDLYYRLYGLTIELPPLRDRGKDIILLAQHFINKFCDENHQAHKILTEKAINKLLFYSFPGNVRELKSLIELAVVISDGQEIDADHITLSESEEFNSVLKNEMTLREYEMAIIKNYLKKYDDNLKIVAEKLDIGLSTLYRLLKNEEK